MKSGAGLREREQVLFLLSIVYFSFSFSLSFWNPSSQAMQVDYSQQKVSLGVSAFSSLQSSFLSFSFFLLFFLLFFFVCSVGDLFVLWADFSPKSSPPLLWVFDSIADCQFPLRMLGLTDLAPFLMILDHDYGGFLQWRSRLGC